MARGQKNRLRSARGLDKKCTTAREARQAENSSTEMDKAQLDKQLRAAAAAVDPNSSHAIASEAAENEAALERFLDESLLDDFKSTPLHTMEGVLEQRQELEERRARLAARSDELMKEELAKRRHDKELRELQDAITERAAEDASAATAPGGRGAKPSKLEAARSLPSKGARSAGPPSADAGPPSALQSKLEGAGRSKNLKPYVYNHTEFVGTADANRHLNGLKKENDLLRKCLQDSRKPGAFDHYLKTNTTF